MVLVAKTSGASLLPAVPQHLTPGLIVAHSLTIAVIFVIIQAARGFKHATSAMAFYGVYHREPLNQLIHFFGVPLILWSLIVFQTHLPLTSKIVVNLPGMPLHYPTYATLIVMFYTFFYLRIDVVGAVLYAPIWYTMYATAVRWTAEDQKLSTTKSWTGTGKLLQWAALVHVLAWYVQIHPGHKVIEGAQPAVLQSLGGALFSAPLFAFYEGVWLIGLRKDFQQQVLILVDEYTRELCEAGVVMRACAKL